MKRPTGSGGDTGDENIGYVVRYVLALDDMVERNELGTVVLEKQPLKPF